MGFVRRNWQIILVIAAFIATYSSLSWSVKNHHDIDEVRESKNVAAIQANTIAIAQLQEIVKSIPRIEDKMDDLTTAVNRLPGKVVAEQKKKRS